MGRMRRAACGWWHWAPSVLLSAFLLLGSGTGPAPASAATNLVANGDFESPTVGGNWSGYSAGQSFGGWTVGSGSVDHEGTFWVDASGSQSVDLNGNGAGSIYQDIATTQGEWYLLRFALAGNPDDSSHPCTGPQGVKRMRLYWAGSAIATLAFDTTGRSVSSMGWTYYQYSVQAVASATQLKLESLTTGVCAGPAIDDVSLTAVPPDTTGVSHNQPDPNGLTGGDPVHTFTGTYTYTHTDMAIPGRGPSVIFARTYNSNDASGGVLGPGWTQSYAARLSDPGDGSGDRILVGPLGRTDRYTRNANGSFTPPPGVTTTLVGNGDGTYTATHPDQTTWTFDSAGKLTRIADRYNNGATLNYTGSQLTSIGDPSGRDSWTLVYGPLDYGDGTSCPAERLCEARDWQSPAARVVRYAYDSSARLWKVTDREGKTSTFGYESTTPGKSHLLTTITDANNRPAISLTYDAQGRVAAQQDAKGLATGQQTTFAYQTNADGTRTTRMTYPVSSFEPSPPEPRQPTVEDTYDGLGLHPTPRLAAHEHRDVGRAVRV